MLKRKGKKKINSFTRDLRRLISKTWTFYTENIREILLVFSIPAVLSYVVLLLINKSTFPAFGGSFLRTIDIYGLPITDLLFLGIVYLISTYLISDAVANINVLIKKERTYKTLTKDIMSTIGTYALRMTIVSVFIILMVVLGQILTINLSNGEIIYAIYLLVLGMLFFYAPPAIIIDNMSPLQSLIYSVKIIGKGYHFNLAVVWMLIGFVSLSVLDAIILLFLTYPLAEFLIILVNAITIYPFLFVLQTHMYMDKYPLTK